MRKLILLLGLVLQVIIVNAQRVSGSLVDEKGNPVSFANVVLLKKGLICLLIQIIINLVEYHAMRIE